jgi:hypothetical protein
MSRRLEIPLKQAFRRKPSDALERSTPPTMKLPPNGGNPVAAVFACLSDFGCRPICHQLPLVAPAGLHKAPSFVVGSGYVTRARRIMPFTLRGRAQNAFAADFHSRRRCAMSSARSSSLPPSSTWRSEGSARRYTPAVRAFSPGSRSDRVVQYPLARSVVSSLISPVPSICGAFACRGRSLKK